MRWVGRPTDRLYGSETVVLQADQGGLSKKYTRAIREAWFSKAARSAVAPHLTNSYWIAKAILIENEAAQARKLISSRTPGSTHPNDMPSLPAIICQVFDILFHSLGLLLTYQVTLLGIPFLETQWF